MQRPALPPQLTNADDIREPLPVTQLPGITETLKHLTPNQANQSPLMLPGRPAPIATNVSVVPPSVGARFGGDIQRNSSDRKEPVPLLNIYTRRADQIGPSHHIPGIGHLGDLLAPPGWKPGDEPVDEAEAQKLFQASRLKAKQMLDEGMSESGQLSSVDQEKRRAEQDAQYHAQRNLDELVLIERVKLHKFWQERKQKHFHQIHSQPPQNRQAEPKPRIRPQPLQPPVETSMTAYQRHQQSLIPASPHLYAPSPPLSGGALNARINFMQQGMIDMFPERGSLGADERPSFQVSIYHKALQ